MGTVHRLTPTTGGRSLPWADRVLAVGTRHGKEHLFAAPLGAATGAAIVGAGIDTDALGTFTGEIARQGTALVTARTKADLAIAHAGADLGLGNEGSFGPHPAVPLVPVDTELVVLRSADGDLEVVEMVTSTDTNHASVDLAAPDVPASFLATVGFPEHALVVSPPGPGGPVTKGIIDRRTLGAAVERCISEHGSARVQADLRAHLNPTRRRVLRELAARLADRLRQRCPTCGAPGWGVVATEPGLPCEWCRGPTAAVAADTYGCASSRCGARAHRPRGGSAPAGTCPRCNP